MNPPRIGLWQSLNGGGKTVLGTLIVALITLFAFLNGIPWASKTEVQSLRTDIQGQLSEIKEDLREIRREQQFFFTRRSQDAR